MKKIAYILYFISSFALAQDGDFKAISSTDQLLIGEPVEITFDLNFPASISLDSIRFPAFKEQDTLGNGWELWKVDSLQINNIETNNGDFITQVIQKIEIANFDTGRHEFPGVVAFIKNKRILSNSLKFSINSIELSDNESIKNIKNIKLDPLTFLEKTILWLRQYWMQILIFLLVIPIVYILYKKLTSKNIQKKIEKPAIPMPIILLEKLAKIEKKKLWQNGKHKQYFTEVNDVARAFIEDRYCVATFEKTSIEIINSLQLASISNDWMAKIEKLFTVSDLVKFAKQIPTNQENIYAIDTVREFIQAERNDLAEKEETEK